MRLLILTWGPPMPTGTLCLASCLVSAARGWGYVFQQHHFSREAKMPDRALLFLCSRCKVWLHSLGGETLGPDLAVTSSQSEEHAECWLMLLLHAQSPAVLYSLPTLSLENARTFASEGQYSIPSRSVYNLGFFPHWRSETIISLTPKHM